MFFLIIIGRSNALNLFSYISTRGPSAPSTPSMSSKKMKNDDDSSTDDLTKDMEEPLPEPNVQEINVLKLGTKNVIYEIAL